MHRPRRAAEAYLRLTSMPGEIGQVDWGHFGHLQIGRARRASDFSSVIGGSSLDEVSATAFVVLASSTTREQSESEP
jgi:hypothetical protein